MAKEKAPMRIMTTEPLLLRGEHVEPDTYIEEGAYATDAELANCVIAKRAVVIRDEAHLKELQKAAAARAKAKADAAKPAA